MIKQDKQTQLKQKKTIQNNTSNYHSTQQIRTQRDEPHQRVCNLHTIFCASSIKIYIVNKI